MLVASRTLPFYIKLIKLYCQILSIARLTSWNDR